MNNLGTKILKHLTALLLLLVLTSCTGAQRDVALQGSAMAGQLAIADRMLQSGDVEVTVLSVSVTAAELDALTNAFTQYEQSRMVLSAIIDNPTQLVDATVLIREEHARLSEAYDAVFDVVSANWDDYGPVQQARLDRWRGQVQRLEESYQRLAAAASEASTETARAQRVVELARIVGQIALLAI